MTRLDQSHATVEWMQAVLTSDEDLLAEVLRLGLQALMEAERDTYVNAAPYVRSGERQTQRNGYKTRQHRTRVGKLELRVPQTRDGGFFPTVLVRRRRSDRRPVRRFQPATGVTLLPPRLCGKRPARHRRILRGRRRLLPRLQRKRRPCGRIRCG